MGLILILIAVVLIVIAVSMSQNNSGSDTPAVGPGAAPVPMPPPNPNPPAQDEIKRVLYYQPERPFWVCPNCACENAPESTHCRVCLWDRAREV